MYKEDHEYIVNGQEAQSDQRHGKGLGGQAHEDQKRRAQKDAEVPQLDKKQLKNLMRSARKALR